MSCIIEFSISLGKLFPVLGRYFAIVSHGLPLIFSATIWLESFVSVAILTNNNYVCSLCTMITRLLTHNTKSMYLTAPLQDFQCYSITVKEL